MTHPAIDITNRLFTLHTVAIRLAITMHPRHSKIEGDSLKLWSGRMEMDYGAVEFDDCESFEEIVNALYEAHLHFPSRPVPVSITSAPESDDEVPF